MSGDNIENDITAEAITDLKETIRTMRKELNSLKDSVATHAGNNPLQLLSVSANAVNISSSGRCLGDGQKKCCHETDYDVNVVEREKDKAQEDDEDASKDDMETLFQVSEAGSAFLEAAFGKPMEAATHKRCRNRANQTLNGPNAQSWMQLCHLYY